MLQHISEPLAELLGQRPKLVDTERIEQAIRDDGGVMFLAETVEEILEDLKWTRRECERLLDAVRYASGYMKGQGDAITLSNKLRDALKGGGE